MSLDVYLVSDEYDTECTCKECGYKHIKTTKDTYYDANITHNLNKMADKAGIYKALWYPDELGLTKAEQLIKLLEKGLMDLKTCPNYFKQFNPSNGWGDYKGLVEFVENYLEACKNYPDSNIEVSK